MTFGSAPGAPGAAGMLGASTDGIDGIDGKSILPLPPESLTPGIRV